MIFPKSHSYDDRIQSGLLNPDLQIHAFTISWSRSSRKPKIHSGRDIPDFLGLFLEEIRFRKDWIDFGKAPKAFEDGDLMHSLIQKDLMSEDAKEVKVKRLKNPCSQAVH